MSADIVDLASADGTPLQVEASGSGVPLILVHGGLNSPRAFDRVLPALTQRYRCLALVRRGYGQSAGPSADLATHRRPPSARWANCLDRSTCAWQRTAVAGRKALRIGTVFDLPRAAATAERSSRNRTRA